MDKFEFYKELYFKENERRMEVQNSMNIPIAVITATASVGFYLITTMNYDGSTLNNWGFYILIGAANIGLLGSIYFLIRAFGEFFKGYEYSSVPYVQQLYNWNKKLEEHYTEHGNGADDAKAHFDNYIVENLIKHTDHNMYVNDQKFSYIFRSKKYLIFTMICTFLSVVPYLYSKFTAANSEPKAEKTEVISLPDNLLKELDNINNSIKTIKYEWKKPKTDTSADTSAAATTAGQTSKRRN